MNQKTQTEKTAVQTAREVNGGKQPRKGFRETGAGWGGHLFEFDMIRCIAMFCIFLFHFNSIVGNNGILYSRLYRYAGRNLTLGQQGVTLFFILSGCTSVLSFRSLRRKAAEASGVSPEALSLKDSVRHVVLPYYGRRLMALLPVFWCAYFAAFVMFVAPGGPHEPWRFLLFGSPAGNEVPGSFLLTIAGFDGYLSMSGFSTSYLVGEWFLGAILILYLLFPVLYLFIRRYPRATAAAVLLLYILYTELYPFGRMKETDALLRIPEFCFGIWYMQSLQKTGWKTAAVSAGVFVLCVLVPSPLDNMYSVLVQGIASFFVLAYLGSLLGGLGGKAAALVRKAVSALAGVSYGIFLVHHFIMDWVIPAYRGTVLQWYSWLRLFAWVFFLALVTAILIRHAASGAVLAAQKTLKKSENKASIS